MRIKDILVYITDTQNNRTEKHVTDFIVLNDSILRRMPMIGVETDIVKLSVSGKTYAERKANLYDKALNIQRILGTSADLDISYGELTTIQHFLETNARRYGYLEEFRESGLC